MTKDHYRGNEIEVTRPRGRNKLSINGETVGTYSDDELAAGVTTDYSYLPSTDLMRLGHLIVDQQLSLTNPTLVSIQRP